MDDRGRVLHKRSRPTPSSEGAEAVVTAIAEACRSVLDETGTRDELSLGLCCPGPIDAKNGIALSVPTICGFVNFPLREAVRNEVGLHVEVENDGPCAALGEWKFGAGKGIDNFVYVTISTGIGGGIISDGQLLRGCQGLAGHIGHLPIKPVGGEVCFCGQIGCWEAEVSGSALQAIARKSGLGSIEAAFERASKQDANAIEFFNSASGVISIGLVALIHLLNPERIVIGGGVSNTLDVLGPMLQERVSRRVLKPFRDVSIVRASLGDNSGLIGAARLALHPDFRN